MPAPAERSFRIVIAQQGERAHLVLAGADPTTVSRERIAAALQEHGIPVDAPLAERLKQLERDVRAGQTSSEPVLLVEGSPPVEGTDARFELAEQLADAASADGDEDRANFYRSQILTVEADTVVGVLTADQPSRPGYDIYGKAIPATTIAHTIKLGANVRFAEDGSSVVATCAGKLHITNAQVAVVPFVEVAGDVDFSTGNLEAPTDVLVNGTVRDSFKIASPASITIRGAIEAAEVDAGTDLQVNGGIAAHGQGRVAAAGELFTKFCTEARLESGGDMTIGREALNSQLRCGGRLSIAAGKLIGGGAYARNGAEIGQLGNEVNVKTEIAVGIDPLALVEAAQADEFIRKRQEAISKIRQNVQPLMAQLKRLTPAQRERATELLYQADSMEQEIAERRARTAAALQPLGADGREVILVVNKVIHPGVSIIFGDKITTMHKERKGPFKVVRRVHERVDEILLIDKLTASITSLGGRRYDPQA